MWPVQVNRPAWLTAPKLLMSEVNREHVFIVLTKSYSQSKKNNSQKWIYILTNREISRKLALGIIVGNLNHFGRVGEWSVFHAECVASPCAQLYSKCCKPRNAWFILKGPPSHSFCQWHDALKKIRILQADLSDPISLGGRWVFGMETLILTLS